MFIPSFIACKNEVELAIPLPAISNPVPWSGDVRIMGNPEL